jgi:DNA replication protein DnaC
MTGPAATPAGGLDEIERLCRRLRMPYLRRHIGDVVATAKAQRWDPAEVVRVLLTEEEQGRDTATRETRRRKAAFPAGKTFDSFEPARFSISRATQDALTTLEWVQRRENLVVSGPSGTGKSHFCEALGHTAINHGLTVTWFGVEQLGSLVARHRIDDTITKALKPVLRSDLVVVDDIGLLPITNDAAEGLYRLVDAAYERRSVAISSNLHPSGFDELMPRTIATALVDRLMHHAHVLVTTGDSVRLTDAADGKGVQPLT